ncbi:MAG: hypothetical protein WAK93_19305 [Solirubrobacteraceae bacterium]
MSLLPARGPRSLAAPKREPLPLGAQLAQDIALAALLGGNLFGRVAMHPALADVSDKRERGQVLNDAWRRYGTVNSTALLALVGGRLVTRRRETSGRWTPSAQQTAVTIKDVAVGAVVVSGLASAASGVGFAQQAPDGAVPMDSGSEPAAETPTRAANLKHLVNLLGGLNLAAELALVAVNAWLADGAPARLP